MQMTIETIQANVAVAILGVEGELDGSNFKDIIAKAEEIYKAGTPNILMDLSNLRFMSSAGLVSLHSIALILRGEKPHDTEGGWNVFHAIGRERDISPGKQAHFKLLNPQPRILTNLQKVGMDELFEIHTDRDMALASFA